MDIAVEAAHRARRRVAPWPHVGAAVVADGQLVGSGATGQYPFGPHAEVAALAEAGSRSSGATLYCTLEPCNHHGNTPPCTEAIIEAGIASVVVAIEDPDPLVAGKGVTRLRQHGIEVSVGLRGEVVADQLNSYLIHRKLGRSACIAKVALSLDGRTAASDGSSRWITGELARSNSHELRADSQAVIVGAGTAIADDPALTVRDVTGPPLVWPPLRVLLDARGRVKPNGKLADTVRAPTLVVVTDLAPKDNIDAWVDCGATVETVNFIADDHGSGVDLSATLELLGSKGVLQAMVEGGSQLHGAFLQAGLVDRVVAYIGNTLLGARGLAGFGLGGPDTISASRRLQLKSVLQLGDDVRLDYSPKGAF